MIKYKRELMKKISVIISSFCVMLSYAQKVSDYQYIAIAEKFESFKNNSYDLDAFLSKNLKSKSYTVLPENRGQWPSEANANPCNVLNANVINDSGFLRNKIILEFKDCNNKVIASQKGSSSIKEFKEGFTDALSRALATVPVSKPVENSSFQPEVSSVKTVHETPQKNEVREDKRAERYSNGKLALQKIQLGSGQFILADGNSSVPFATFKETTKKDVFRVKLSSGATTIGYYENGNIVIEIPKSNEGYSKEVFSSSK